MGEKTHLCKNGKHDQLAPRILSLGVLSPKNEHVNKSVTSFRQQLVTMKASSELQNQLQMPRPNDLSKRLR